MNNGKDMLESSSVRDAATDAYLLLNHVSGKDRTFIFAHGDEEVPERVEQMYTLMIEKRASHEPLQYITGTQDFMGLDFYVNQNVLVPRQDTEFLVEEMMKDVEDGSDVLDMCTGSGCILLSLMSYKNDINGTGADISAEALEVAKINAANLHKSPKLIQSNMFSSIKGNFDYIVSNPPYIRTADIRGLDPEVRDHEPVTALDGDSDGLKFYRIIADGAKPHLKRSGGLYVEIGYDQGESVRNIFECAGYTDIQVIRDYSGNERVVKCLKDWKI